MAEEVTSSSGSVHSDSGPKVCQICGDVSTGYYYNVWSCEGCKAFFKRCLQIKEGAHYVCPATNNCTIDKTRRKCCQACRLRKCYEAGMRKIGARRERSRKSKDDEIGKINKRKRKSASVPDSGEFTELSSDFTHEISKEKKCHNETVLHGPCVESDATSCDSEGIIKCPTSVGSVHSTPPVPNTSSDVVSSKRMKKPCEENLVNSASKSNTDKKNVSSAAQIEMPIHRVVATLLEIEPPERTANHIKSEKETEESLMTSFVQLADKELVDVITWAKGVPAFSSLTLSDKIHLVDCCWMEILVCGLCWRSKNAEGSVLRFAEDLVCDRDMYYTAGIGPICDRMVNIAQAFRDLDLSKEEFVCIRALTLLNADLTNLEQRDHVLRARQQIVEALIYTERRLNAPEHNIFTLLLLLPHIRQCGVNATAHMFELQHEEAFPIAHLVKEMLEVQQTYTSKSTDNNIS